MALFNLALASPLFTFPHSDLASDGPHSQPRAGASLTTVTPHSFGSYGYFSILHLQLLTDFDWLSRLEVVIDQFRTVEVKMRW